MADITIADVNQSNSVIHVIDRVLMPAARHNDPAGEDSRDAGLTALFGRGFACTDSKAAWPGPVPRATLCSGFVSSGKPKVTTSVAAASRIGGFRETGNSLEEFWRLSLEQTRIYQTGGGRNSTGLLCAAGTHHRI